MTKNVTMAHIMTGVIYDVARSLKGCMLRTADFVFRS